MLSLTELWENNIMLSTEGNDFKDKQPLINYYYYYIQWLF